MDPATGEDPPTPLGVLRRIFGYPSFRGQQQEIVEHVVAGGDAIVLMPTGGGKSLCYQLPALLRTGLGVVVSPLIALMKDQVDALRQAGVRAAALNSGLPPGEAGMIERAVHDGALDLLYVSPERLMMPHCLEMLRRCRIALFATDEAHCISQCGHDFRRDYQTLGILHQNCPETPLMAPTATAGGPAPLSARGRRHHRRHRRLRHGHRQAQRPLCRATRRTEKPRSLLPGDRPGRTRRAAVGCVDELRHRRRDELAAPDGGE